MKFIVSILVTMVLLHVAHSQLEASSQQADAGAIMEQVRRRMETFKAYHRETIEIMSELSHPEADHHYEKVAGAPQHPQASAQELLTKIAVATLVVGVASLAVGTVGAAGSVAGAAGSIVSAANGK